LSGPSPCSLVIFVFLQVNLFGQFCGNLRRLIKEIRDHTQIELHTVQLPGSLFTRSSAYNYFAKV